ncbi:glycosyltransferase family 2 protein [Aliarcobacter butzleri]|uniref:glycosyltransferase family 2 protein n=1 Tax=Aliarcobacter butzleri TaxID=28197 RepID=UPI0021B1F94A|nr:glycosyltransferase family 2 protein [Aliarcobacter butzleri]MCT7590786.1 glycosyltransferase family 2 protein [Aliarcobacter butzleri]
MTKKDIGIVICNFNKVDYLKGCLETLYKSNFENLTYDVIVVDNASTDGSSKFVKDNYSQIILLENETNTGGSGGFDRGIRYSIQKKYDYVVLLDNDILLETNTILNLFKYIKINPEIGVVGSKICTMDNRDILQEMGSFIDFDNKFNVYTPLKSHKDDNSIPEIVNCDYVPACCMITSKEVLKKVGSFNTEHFIYWDDMDWCTRVKKAGYKIHAINSSRVFHKMGVLNHTNTFGLYYFERNRIMFFLKYIEDDDKFDKFSYSLCDWFLRMSFFSNLKRNYATPKSFLCAIDDLFIGKLGKQDDSIFIKEPEQNIFEKYDLSEMETVVIYMQKDMISNRRVYLYLKNFYRKISLYCDEENYDLIKSNFDEKIISQKEFCETNFKTIFYVQEHILDFKENKNFDDRYIFIDQYINVLNLNEIKNLNSQYKMYEDIFKNIYQPVLYKKFKLIRTKIRNINEKKYISFSL